MLPLQSHTQTQNGSKGSAAGARSATHALGGRSVHGSTSGRLSQLRHRRHLGRTLLSYGGRPEHRRMLSNIPGPYPLEALFWQPEMPPGIVKRRGGGGGGRGPGGVIPGEESLVCEE